MIFDSDTHLAPKPEGGNSVNAEGMVRLMDMAGVDKCLSWVYPPYVKTDLNDYVAYVSESMKKYPDRIYGFGWIDPSLGINNAVELTKRCMQEYGMYGVKLNGSQNKYFIDDSEKTYPIIDVVRDAGKIVAFHTGSDDPNHVHPYRAEHVINAYPDVHFLLIHMGGELYQAAIEVAQRCKNVTLVGSEAPKTGVAKAIQALGADRVSYGSDAPFCMMAAEVAAYKGMLKEIELSDEDIDKVMWKNTASLIGI